ncbi:MAG: hypothetical protein O2887_05745 [Bacteroidetes bacterium]|nr:hypothetical protein [Bacteroidota bacterium]MDA1119985.1 hypothetical protein [Bacteroidota bacterium]
MGSCSEGYYNSEGLYIKFDDDDDDDDDQFEDEFEGEFEDGIADFDDDDIEDEHEDDGECEDGFGVQNVMATVTYKVSENLPVLVQVAGGYSVGMDAPAISAFVGYNQKIWSNLGVTGGVRYSTVFNKVPFDAVNYTRSGFKAELGISWNF